MAGCGSVTRHACNLTRFAGRPVPLDVLLAWIADERMAAKTWIYKRPPTAGKRGRTYRNSTAFCRGNGLAAVAAVPIAGAPGSLQRVKILADLNDAQLAHLAEFLELQEVKQFKTVVNQCDAGDAMFMVLAGELRARTTMGGRETILMTFSPGDIFGEMALFDQGPRSADVVANVDGALLKLSTVAFQRLTREAPSLATPFLQATSRIRAENKRLMRVTEQFSAGFNG